MSHGGYVARAPRRLLVTGLCLSLVALVWVPCFAQGLEQPLAPIAILTVQGMFTGKPNKVAKDLSGMACQPLGTSGARECLVINDEGAAAQRATLAGTTLRPGSLVPLINGAPPVRALGKQPTINCTGGADASVEFDGEGVTFAFKPKERGGTYYVVGSHGCSRKKNTVRLSSFLLARIEVGADGMLGTPELTWRLSDALRGNVALGPKFARALNQEEDGLNIEGIATAGGDLLFGMRAPVGGGQTFIARVSASALFAAGSSGQPVAHVTSIQLGKNTGIRDMATLPDGRLLVLSGPAVEKSELPSVVEPKEPTVPYALWIFDARQDSHLKPTKLAELQDVIDRGERAKAEAVTVLGVVNGEAQILILFDGVENGGPREYRVRLF